jgi:hypothetical protein
MSNPGAMQIAASSMLSCSNSTTVLERGPMFTLSELVRRIVCFDGREDGGSCGTLCSLKAAGIRMSLVLTV